jgi:tetratricopeptide (TPR) repeat protein
MLIDLGADNSHIEVAPNFDQAADRIARGPLNILITDDDIGEDEAVDRLLKLHQTANPSAKNRLFVLMCSELTSEQRSNYMFRGVDLIIPKPFTNSTFTEAFLGVVQMKDKLTEDEGLALDVYDALKENNRPRANELYLKISNPDAHPGLYSKGLITNYDQDFQEAFKYFLKSAEKKIDLNGLVHLFSTGSKVRRYEDLATYAERWIREFPLHLKSVPDITRVVLYTKKFSLLKEMKIDEVEGQVPLAAGCIVVAMFYEETGNRNEAISFALRGLENSCLRPAIVMRGLEILKKLGAQKEAKAFISQRIDRATGPDAEALRDQIHSLAF